VSFLFPTLLSIGLPLIAVPVIIHLINLRRHRRIKWAAMEFLLASQKRRRKWVILKQLLLLLTRMAVFAAVAFMLARPVLESSWAAIVGGAETHHVVLLDDSFSMSDRDTDGATAYGKAQRVVEQLVEQSNTRGGRHFVTIVRFSEARALSVGSPPEFYRKAVSAELPSELADYFALSGVSQSDAGPAEALAAASRLPEQTREETRLVYLVSDFRRRQWDRPADVRAAMARLAEQNARLQLVHCTRSAHPNLTLTRLQPQDGVGAAGTEMWMEVGVMNYSEEPASGVAIQIEQDGENRGAIELDTIPPHEELTARFRSSFATVGAHALAAQLPADAVDVDNRRYAALNVPAGYSVLIIDGTQTGRDGFFLQSALSPGGSARTNWQPQVEPPSFLRNPDRLGDFAAIFLLDVSRLDRPEVDALEEYVRCGGGIGLFLGTNVDPAFYNETLYRDGAGLFPAHLSVPTQLVHTSPGRLSGGDEELRVPDVEVVDHPIFRAFTTSRNTFLDAVLIEYYYGLDRGWTAAQSPDVRTIASVRAPRGYPAPLVLEKSMGDGRVVAFLTKLSAEKTSLGRWNNWLGNPLFPVMMQEAASYLSATRRAMPHRLVGEPLSIEAPEAEFAPDFQVTMPLGGQTRTESIVARPDGGNLTAEIADTSESGIYQVELVRRDGTQASRAYCVNVQSDEGDLRTLGRTDLETKLEGLAHTFHWSDDFAQRSTTLAGFQMSDALLYAIIGLLIGEQLLAYSASYHPPRKEGAA
jgi:hypothetical protein